MTAGGLVPVRVLVVSHAARVWGAEQVVLRLAPLLVERGIDVRLASPTGGEPAAAWQGLGLPLVPLDLPLHRGLRRADGRRASPWQLAREALLTARSSVRVARLARGFDIVHSNSLDAHLAVALGAKLARRHAVLHQHDLVVPGMGRRVLATAARLADATVAISRAVADCVPAGRVVVVPNGVDELLFAPGPSDPSVRRSLGGVPEAPLVGVLGRIDPEKRVDMVVRAVAALPPRLGARLVVVGAPFRASDEHARRVRDDAERLLPGRVRFVPPRTDVPEVLRALDVLVSAAVAEPFGLTIIEAQATGTPVVAVRSGGVPEIVADGVTGLLVGSEVELARALEAVVTDPDRARSLARGGREAVCAGYTLHQQAERLAGVYRELVGSG